MVASPGPGPAPTPLVQLREPSQFPSPEEFSLRHWLTSAQSLIQKGKHEWTSATKPGGDPSRAEDAFKMFRKVAEVFQIISKHPNFQAMLQNKSPEYATYVGLRGDVLQLKELQKDVATFLERREAAWLAAHPPAAPLSEHNGNGRGAGAAPTRANGVVKASPLISDDGVGAFIDSYSQASPSPPQASRMGHAAAPTPPASPPPKSLTLAERMAALSSNGMKTATVRPMRNSLPPQPIIPPPQPPLSRNPTGGSNSSLTLQAPGSPVVPRKPESLMRRTPPGSPAEDSVAERSGSAPPAIPALDRGRTGMLNGGGSNGSVGSRDNSRQPSPVTPASVGLALDLGGGENAELEERQHRTADWMRQEQLSSLRSPSEFAGQFPSVDDLERTDFAAAASSPTWSTRHEGPFPSVPTSKPGAPPALSHPLPPPPKPFDLQAASGPRSPLRPLESQPRPPPAQAAPPPPPTTTTKTFSLPFSSDILPADLYAYLEMALGEDGRGPRVLMLDLRTREEFDAGHVIGEVVCLEPIVIRDGRTGYDLESSLTLSPPSELSMFSSRNKYDVIVVYDRASTSIPTYAPPSTGSEAQRVLWNLNNAIYEKEFTKSLKRQPMLLKGGWEAWEKKVGSKGIVRDGVQPQPEQRPRASSTDDYARLEAKKANRKVTVVQGANDLPPRNGGGGQAPLPPSTFASGRSSGGDYFSPSPAYGTNTFSPTGPLMSPRLAMPSPALHRPGVGQAYDYTLQSSTSNRPSYPQPHLNGLASSTSSANFARPPASQAHDQSQQSYSPYQSTTPRTSIDYPQLRQPLSLTQQSPTTSSRPPPPIPAHALPPTPLARPAAVQPAPMRSSSSFSGVAVSPYATPNTNSSRFANQINFGDDAIGLTGLKNLGNTCYMNSTVQCLSATIPFARYFKEGRFKADINLVNPLGTKGALASAVAELIRAIWAQSYIFLSPVTFRENICKWAPQFRGTEQHDAQEFLGFLLDGLHEDLNYVTKKPPVVEMSPEREHDLETLPQQIMSEREWDIYRRRNDSFVVQCFQGQFRNQMKCLTCGKTSTTYNTFMPLSVPIPSGRGVSKVDLQACIASFVREEILDKDDAWNCPRCKTARKASKKLTLSRLPPILVIHLKRFSFKGPFSDKIETQVQYPLSGLDLTSFMPPPLFDKRAPASNSAPKGHVYDLYGVTNHFGNLSSGHYTAYVRNHHDWHNIGDSKVTQVDPSSVQSASGDDAPPPVASSSRLAPRRRSRPHRTDAELVEDWLKDGEADPLLRGLRQPWWERILRGGPPNESEEERVATFAELLRPPYETEQESSSLLSEDVKAAEYLQASPETINELQDRVYIVMYGDKLPDRQLDFGTQHGMSGHKSRRRYYPFPDGRPCDHDLIKIDPSAEIELERMISPSVEPEVLNVASDSDEDLEEDVLPLPVAVAAVPVVPAPAAMSAKRAGKQRAQEFSATPPPAQHQNLPTPDSNSPIDFSDDETPSSLAAASDEDGDNEAEARAPQPRKTRVKALIHSERKRKVSTRASSKHDKDLPSYTSYLIDPDLEASKVPRRHGRSAGSTTASVQPEARVPTLAAYDDGSEEVEAPPRHPHPERDLNDHFYSDPLPSPLNKHNKPIYDLETITFTRRSAPCCLLDLHFSDRRKGAILTGKAKPRELVGGVDDRTRNEVGSQQRKEVHIHHRDVRRLDVGLEYLVLETKCAKFRLRLDKSNQSSVSFTNARIFLSLLAIGQQNQLYAEGNSIKGDPTLASIEDLIAKFRRVDPLPYEAALDALADFEDNPIALLLVKTLPRPSYVHPQILDRLLPFLANMPHKGKGLVRTDAAHDSRPWEERTATAEAVLLSLSEEIAAWWAAKHDHAHDRVERPTKANNRLSQHHSNLLDPDKDEDDSTGFRTFRRIIVDGIEINEGDFLLLAGERNLPNKRSTKGKMSLEHVADEEEEALAGQEEDRERERAVTNEEAWIGHFVYAIEHAGTDRSQELHVRWFEKGRDSQLLHHSSALQLIAVDRCDNIDVGTVVRKIEVERLPRGECFPSRPDKLYYSSFYDDGAYLDAIDHEDAPWSNKDVFVQNRVAFCKCCDRRLSAELKRRVVYVDTPEENLAHDDGEGRILPSENDSRAEVDGVSPEDGLTQEEYFDFVLDKTAKPPFFYESQSEALPCTSFRISETTYHLGDTVYVNFNHHQDPESGPFPLRLAQLVAIDPEILPDETHPRVRLLWMFRHDDLHSSDRKDDRKLITSKISDYDRTADKLEGKFKLYHSSEWRDDYLKDPHRFHTDQVLDRDDDEFAFKLYDQRKCPALHPSTSNITLDRLGVCPSCRSDEDENDARSARLASCAPGLLIESYAGAGGLCLGLRDACPLLDLGLAIDRDKDAVAVLKHNVSGHVAQCPADFLIEEPAKFIKGTGKNAVKARNAIQRALMFSGGPPCQAFSSVNTFASLDDARCWEPWVWLTWVLTTRPPICLLENVRRFANFSMPGDDFEGGPKSGGYHKLMAGLLAAMRKGIDILIHAGYQVRTGILLANAYGAPEIRRRFFILAALRGMVLPQLPQPTHACVMDPKYLQLPTTFRGDEAKGSMMVSSYPPHVAPHPPIMLQDALSDLPRFGYANKDPKPMHLPQPYETTPFVAGKALGFDKPVAYASAPRNNFQALVRGGGEKVDLHLTAGFQREVYAKRLCEIKVSGCDAHLDDDTKPPFPPATMALLKNAPTSARAKALKTKWWARATANSFLTPLRTFSNIDGSHGPRIHYMDARMFSLRERARIQTFPDGWNFWESDESGFTNAERLIGNAVPVVVARAIGREVYLVLCEAADESEPNDPYWRLFDLSDLYKRSTYLLYPSRAQIADANRRMSVDDCEAVSTDVADTSIVEDSQIEEERDVPMGEKSAEESDMMVEDSEERVEDSEVDRMSVEDEDAPRWVRESAPPDREEIVISDDSEDDDE